MVDRPRVLDLLAAGEAYLADVRRFRDEVGRARFLAAHLVAETAGLRPDTLAELFTTLAGRGTIDPDLAERLGALARFRNLLVHEYADVDAQRVWEIIASDLGDVDAFLGVVARRVES